MLAWSLSAPAMAVAADPLTPAQFRDAYIAELRKQVPDVAVRVISETELRIKAKGADEEQIAYLDNAYRRYRADPAALDQTLRQHVGVTVNAMTRTDTITAANALVLIRQADFLDSYKEMLRSQPPKDGKPQGPLAFRPLPGGLIMLIAADYPDAYRYSSSEDVVEKLGPLDEAWSKAIANTERLIGEADGAEAGAIVVLTTRNGSASSLLVVDSFWRKLEASGLGSPVVLLADRNTLAVGFEDRAESLGDLKMIARKLVEEPGEFDEPMLSSSLLARRNGQWTLYADYPYR